MVGLNERGSILIMAIMAMLLLAVLALSFTMVGVLEGKMGSNYASLVRAVHVADAGIEGVKRELIDFVNSGPWTGTWTPALLARGTCSGASVNFNSVPTGGAPWVSTGANATLFIVDNDNSTGVTWENGNVCSDVDGIVTIGAIGRLATGTGLGANRPVWADVSYSSENLWDGAANGNSGGGGVIQGNAKIYGTVRLFQSGGGLVWDMGGGAGIRNNYIGNGTAADALRAATRDLLNPTLRNLGDIALNARFIVQQGTVNFSGGAEAGLSQGGVTNRKQTLDAALANEFDAAGNSDIHADRTGPYGGALTFPLLSDQVSSIDARSWEAMLNQDGLHITAADLGGNRIDGSLGPAFCRPMPCGTLSATPVPSKFNLTITGNTATLSIQGIIVFDNFPSGVGLQIGKKTGSNQLDTITYTGSGVIFVDDASQSNCSGGNVCAGNLTLVADILTPNNCYPTCVNPPVYPPVAGTVNNIGFMAERIGLARGADDSNPSGASQLTMTGLYYAQTRLYSCKQNEILGSLLSRVVTMSCNVPKIAAVRNMVQFLPAHLIGSTQTNATLAIVRWREGTQ